MRCGLWSARGEHLRACDVYKARGWARVAAVGGAATRSTALPPLHRHHCRRRRRLTAAAHRHCRRELGAAIWRPELGLAEVVLQKGKLLAHMGFTRGSKLYLFIEEAV